MSNKASQLFTAIAVPGQHKITPGAGLKELLPELALNGSR